MIEVLAFPALVIAAACFPKRKTDEKKTIQTIMKNIKLGINNGDEFEIPKFKKKQLIFDGVPKNEEEEKEMKVGVVYAFEIPPGMRGRYYASLEKQNHYFEDTIGRPVEVSFSSLAKGEPKTFNVSVYDQELTDFVPYKSLPAPPKIKDRYGSDTRHVTWNVPIGMSVSGLIWHNFEHIPMMTAAGTTRFGKTVLLRMMMTYLIEHHPNDVEFYIIDLKGGLEFSRYKNLKQVKWVATSAEEAFEMLCYLTNHDIEKLPPGIFEKEFDAFVRKGISNVTETNLKKRRFIIVDEGAQLNPGKFLSKAEAKMLNMCQAKLSRIAALFGALGVRQIFATQYPTSDSLPPQIKMNSDIKVSFRLPAGYASQVAIDDYGAEELPSTIKGRALIKTHELKEVQVPFITHAESWERLQRYQDPVKTEGEKEDVILYNEERIQTGGHTEHDRQIKGSDKGTDTDDSRIRF